MHGRCTVAATKQAEPNGIGTCGSCGDYLGRELFGPDSAAMRRRAEEYIKAVPPYPEGRYQGRGVVVANSGDRSITGLYVAIRALRHLGCSLPIQVWYLGRNAVLSAKEKGVLAPFQVECVDVDKIRRRHATRQLDGGELKVFATLHSPFEEVLFLDAHCYPCRNPEFLFEREDYCAQGAVFWPQVDATDTRLKWAAFGLASPRRLGTVDSDEFLFHKALSWRPLHLAWFYHDHSNYYDRYCRLDKHTLEVAWTHCAQRFVMWQPTSRRVDAGCLHNGPDFLPLIVNRYADPFSFASHGAFAPQQNELSSSSSALPLERECWDWLAELARLMGQTRFFARTTAIKELPPCRWRKISGDGSILCSSEKLVYAPNRVAPDMCRNCTFPDHVAAPVYQPHYPIPLEFGMAAPYSIYEPPKTRTKSKRAIAIATLYTPEIAELGQLTSQAMRAYAERHGYTAVVARSSLDLTRHPYWSKIVLVEHYLVHHPSCQWLMWMDADAVITNPAKPLEDFLEKDTDFIVAEDGVTPINSGVFLMRNCAATIYVLRRAYAKITHITHYLPEQMAISEALLESGKAVATRIVSRRLLNSFAHEHQEGDFIIHFAAMPNAMKLAGANEAIASTYANVLGLLPAKTWQTKASNRRS